MKRNNNLDIVRGITILIIVFYHIYAIANMHGYGPGVYIPVATELLMYGGEIGVTLFFIMSGYGIYCSLSYKDKESGRIEYIPYMKKRFKRIAPQYYVSLGILLCISGQAAQLGTQGIKHVLTHVLFIHNLWPDTSGSINGVLWTMGTIVQFYVISVLLYRLVKKSSIAALLMSVIITVGFKYIFFHVMETGNYFIYGRQLLTAIDNFVIGMVLAKYVSLHEDKEDRSAAVKIICFAACMCIFAAFIYFTGKSWVIYEDSVIGYCWHSMLALLLGLTVLCFLRLEINQTSMPARAMHYMADVQYGIYIWHLVVIQTLLASSPYAVWLAQRSFAGLLLALTAISIVVGIISTRCIDGKGLLGK